jgi:hypothetical protein
MYNLLRSDTASYPKEHNPHIFGDFHTDLFLILYDEVYSLTVNENLIYIACIFLTHGLTSIMKAWQLR